MTQTSRPVLVLRALDARGPAVLAHGGAGHVAEARRLEHVEGCRTAARAGRDVLARGGSALDAVEAAVRALEDDPSFNAGTGACLNEAGYVEHDASIMRGEDLHAGAVAALRGFAAPIAIARAALEDGRHVLYAGDGARAFALAHGFVEVGDKQLVTEAARRALAAARRGDGPTGWAGGTVGAVALDRHGHVAAATSTGGTVDKRVGRVGDSPIVGAGTYADDAAGAVSTTGHGESMLRLCVAKVVCDAMRAGASPELAARDGIASIRDRFATTGGLVAIAPNGRAGFARSTETMSWAFAFQGGDEAGI